jgi:hypothetical protein
MKIELQRPNLISRTKRRTIVDRFREVGVLSLCALLLVTPEMQAAKPGGVAVLLPPFIPVLPPTPFLQPISPFAMTGFIQSMAVKTPTDIFSEGTFVMNGITINVPRNTILQMPAAAMTWAELWSNAPAGYKNLNQTGLALSDGDGSPTAPKPPLASYEITVNGNRVINGTTSDQYVAGLIFISQQSINTSQGFINSIDYSRVPSVVCPSPTGGPGTPCGPVEILVSQKLNTPPVGAACPLCARIRINTPNGRYGNPDPNADVRFTSDEDNPTIVARNGYPMCLPRANPTGPTGKTDSLCPQWNRPTDPFTGAYSVNYTMQPATAGAPVAGITHQAGYPSPKVTPDPFEQAPFEVGDYITYIGTLTADPPGTPNPGQYISAHTIVAEVAIQTAPGTWPVYTYIDDLRIFVGGTPNPIFPLEAQEKIFGDAFTTDYSQIVDIYAVDVDPCTGARTHRFYMSSDPFGPPLGGLRGRARFRSTIGNFLPATREMAAVSRSMTGGQPVDAFLSIPANQKLVANGLQAGIFQAPQFTFIFPENLVIGSQQIPLTFEQFPFLVNGSGPYTPFNTAPPAGPITPITPQGIQPFPSLSAPPATTSCSVGGTFFQPPTSDAGAPQSVPSGITVTLDGRASQDSPLNSPQETLIYTWIQSAGPSVGATLIGANTVTPQFTAPAVAAGSTPVVLTFQLAVCNSFNCGGISTVNVTVMPAAGAPQQSLTASNQHPGPGAAMTITSAATGGTPFPARNDSGSPQAPYTYSFTQTAGTPQMLTGGANTSTLSFFATAGGAPLAPLTFQCTVTDAAGYNSTATISVFVGSDTVTPTNTVYSLSKGRLQVAMSDTALPKGSAIITVTPMVNGVAIAAGIVATYDPGIDGYNILAAIVNPIPDSIKITSNYGFGPVIFPITRIR